CLLARRVEEATQLATRALALAREHGEGGFEAMALRIAGEAALAREDVATAEASLSAAAAAAEALRMRPLLGHCGLGLALTARRRGDGEQSRRRLTAARERYAELGMDAWVRRVAGELSADA